MKIIIFSTFLLALAYSRSSWSEDSVVTKSSSEVKNMGEMLAQIKLEKKQMENIVDKLVISGRLSPEHAIRAKREIASVKEEDTEEVKLQIMAMLSSRQKN
jgi:polyhydroxyalkanoate synthesis regulator phasin